MKRAEKRGTSEQSATKVAGLTFAAFVATWIFLTTFGVRPEGRVWAWNHWAGWRTGVAPLAVAIFLGGIWVWFLRPQRWKCPGGASPRESAPRSPLLVAAAFALTLFLAFIALRQNNHFWGDGYQTLSLLAGDPARVKETAPLLALVLPKLRPLFGADPEHASLRALQFLSIGCGVAMVLALAEFSRRRFAQNFARMVFVLIPMTCGFALLFFGYVETYAPFVLALGCATLVGLAVEEGRLRRIWILPIAAACLATHIFGITALPGLLDVYFRSPGRESGKPKGQKHVPVSYLLAAGIVASAMLYLAAKSSSTVEVALLPFFSNWHTVDGYTIFSAAHLLDFANLVALQIPGTLVFLAWCVGRRKHSFAGADRFALAFLVPQFWAAFLLNPGLGMARDWDLFSFPFVGASILAGYVLARSVETEVQSLAKAPGAVAIDISTAANPTSTAALGMILLGGAVLIPRVLEGRFDDVTIRRFQNVLNIDPGRSGNGRYLLIDYYRNRGLLEEASVELQNYERDHPAREIIRSAHRAFQSGDTSTALKLSDEALRIQPTSGECYLLRAEYLIAAERAAEAEPSLRRAQALQANGYRTFHARALVAMNTGREAEAEKFFRRALSLKPQSFEANLGLATLYRRQGRQQLAGEYLARAAASPGAPPEIVAEAETWKSTPR